MFPSVVEDDTQNFEFRSFAALRKRHLADTVIFETHSITFAYRMCMDLTLKY